MNIYSEHGKGKEQGSAQQSRVQLAIAGKLPLPDDARSVDMKRASAYLPIIAKRIISPAMRKLVPLLEELKDEAYSACNGHENAERISGLKFRLQKVMGWVTDAIVKERSSLVGGEFSTERGALSAIQHYTNSAFSPLISNAGTLLIKMGQKSDKTFIVAIALEDDARKAYALLSALCSMEPGDERAASMLFRAFGTRELISALNMTAKREFGGTMHVRSEGYHGIGAHSGEEARGYLQKALCCTIRANRAIKPEKEKILSAIIRLEAGENATPDISAALRGIHAKISKRSRLLGPGTPEAAAHEWVMTHYMDNAAGMLAALASGGNASVLVKKAEAVRDFFSILDGLKSGSLYEMKVILECQHIEDVVLRLR